MIITLDLIKRAHDRWLSKAAGACITRDEQHVVALVNDYLRILEEEASWVENDRIDEELIAEWRSVLNTPAIGPSSIAAVATPESDWEGPHA